MPRWECRDSQSIVRLGSGLIDWSVNPNSQLPPGLAFSAAGVLSGTPTQAGTYTFTLQTPSTLQPGVFIGTAYTLRVSGIAITDPQILPTATPGVPYNHTMSATGATSLSIWSATGLPSGLTMSPGGTISGAVTANVGTSSVIVTVTDGATTLQRRFTLFISTPNPFIVSYTTATALPDVTVGQGFQFSLVPNGGVPPYAWTFASGTFPPGLSLISGAQLPPNFTPGSTLLAGLPTTVGLYTFDLIATDSAGEQMRRTFTLRVTPVSIIAGNPRSSTMGAAYAQQFTAVGGSGSYTFSMSPISATVEMLPPGLVLSASGLLSGTPTSTGTYFFRLHATDSLGATFSRTYGFTVTNAAGQFVNNANLADVSVGAGRTQVLAVGGASPATYTWSVVGAPLPPGLELISGGTFPGPNTTALVARPTSVGTHVYTLRATDTLDSANTVDHVFTLRVVPMQIVSPPIEFGPAELPSGNVGAPYPFALKVAGGTGPYTFSASALLPLPAGLSISPAGVVSGTPQQTGFHSFTVVVTDAEGHTFTTPFMIMSITNIGTAAPLLASSLTGLSNGSVGVPYKGGPLNRLLVAGTAPFTWNVSMGSSLPPGMSILQGSNGVSDVLGGVPTEDGTFTFSLTAVDATGQTLTLPQTLLVTDLALIPEAVPNGMVGAKYGLPGLPGMDPSVTLSASGGMAPYTVALSPLSDLPPGVQFVSGPGTATLSGTPTHPGNFFVVVTVTDGDDEVLTKGYMVTIDNAAGQAPALSLSPKPIQVFHVQGTFGSCACRGDRRLDERCAAVLARGRRHPWRDAVGDERDYSRCRQSERGLRGPGRGHLSRVRGCRRAGIGESVRLHTGHGDDRHAAAVRIRIECGREQRSRRRCAQPHGVCDHRRQLRMDGDAVRSNLDHDRGGSQRPGLRRCHLQRRGQPERHCSATGPSRSTDRSWRLRSLDRAVRSASIPCPRSCP